MSKAGTNLTYNAQVTYAAGNHVIPHAVSAANSNTYSYDCNSNQTTRQVEGQTFNLSYDAENRLATVTGPSLTASFVYDGDGNRVKSTINGTTTTFIDAHYEVTGSQVRKYYSRSQRSQASDIIVR